MKKVRKLKFALLGLGTVVKLRVSNIFKNELKKILRLFAFLIKIKIKDQSTVRNLIVNKAKMKKNFF